METNTMTVSEEALKKEVPTLVTQAQDFKVTTDLAAEEAAGILNTLKTKLDLAKEFFAPLVETAHAAHKAVCSRRNEITEPLETAKKILTQKVADYSWEKQKKAQAAEDKAKADAKAREDAKKKKLLDEAKIAREAGDHEKAARLTEQAGEVYVAPRTTAPAFKPTGVTARPVWVAEIVDEKKVPVKWRGEIDVVRLQKAKTNDPTLTVPGINFVQRAQGAVRGAR